MNIKKKVIDEITYKLRAEQSSLRYKIASNKRDFKKMVEQQQVNKRKLAAIEDLIRSISPTTQTSMKRHSK